MSRILPLSSEAVSQIQSSKQIISLQGVILGLLENSLDAGSNKVGITFDLSRGDCSIEDNGDGILPAEFLENGGLLRMYHTSKRNSASATQLHGSTGTYLAFVAALSLLKVTSCHLHDDRQASLTVYRGQVIHRDVPASLAHPRSLSTPRGTCVTVRDLFGNMPVRVKQRSLVAEPHQDNDKAWQEMKRGIVALLLAWPHPCSVRIRDEQNASRALHLTASFPTISTVLTENAINNLDKPQAKYDVKDSLAYLWQAGLTGNESRGNWIPVSATTPAIAVKGLICLDPTPTKQCQFISIGVQPLSHDIRHSIYDSVNKIFTNSSFGTVDEESDIDDAENRRRKHDRRYKPSGYTRRQLHGRKSVDRWPMFVLNITLHDQQKVPVDCERISDAGLKAIDDVLTTMITQWLAAKHFRPRKLRSKNEARESPAISEPATGSSPDTFEPRSYSQTPGTTTPSGTTSHRAGAASKSKKRKIAEMDGRSRRLQSDQGVSTVAARDSFYSWSRIKSGRNSFYDSLWDGQKPATAPAGQMGTKTSDLELRPKTAFHLPPVEAGELNSKDAQMDSSVSDTCSPGMAPEHNSMQHPSEDIPSEDFGSFDESEILAAVESFESSCLHGRLPDPLDDEIANSPGLEDDRADQILEWKDPVSNQTHKINSRTGVALASNSPAVKLRLSVRAEESQKTRDPRTDGTTFSVEKSLTLARRPEFSDTSREKWLPGFLKEWNNPVFAQQREPRIPAVSSVDFTAHTMESANKAYPTLAQAGTAITRKLSKGALSQARVINQVDRKYVLCTMGASPTEPNSSGETLILVDQHAASERVILENLLSELCTSTTNGSVQSIPLDKALRFDISAMEFQRFREHEGHFASWGIVFDLSERNTSSSVSYVRPPQRHYTIIVRSLPPGIAERCTLVPKVLIDMLRAEIWSLAEHTMVSHTTSRPTDDTTLAQDDPHAWLQRIGSCPKGIIDMLNSRACRSAIMFNDELSVAECEGLMADLSRSAFPFMCAHGRVSMVPVADLGTALGGEGDAGSASGGSFTEAFARWRGSRKSSDNRMDA